MGKRVYRFDPLRSGYPGRQGRLEPYHCEWGVIVGDRIRRLRRERSMTLIRVLRRMEMAPHVAIARLAGFDDLPGLAG